MEFSERFDRLVVRFHSENLFPVVATEIEFYLHGASLCSDMASFEAKLLAALQESNIRTGPFEKERGLDQYELALALKHDMRVAVADCVTTQLLVKKLAAEYGLRADFSAKPSSDKPGSGLHIHVHLEDERGVNLFTRQEEFYSAPLLHAVAGLLIALPESMVFFAPSEASYARFVKSGNAPTTVSWGPNNRTVAVRLPTKPMQNKHLEHRVSGADANPEQAVFALLAAMHHGLANQLAAPEPIFGDAALPLYALPALPKNLLAAQTALEQGTILRHYF